LHVEEETPVHVHVLSRGQGNASTTALNRTSSAASIPSRPQSRGSRPGSSRSRNPSGASKGKSVPWIPPGKASLKPSSGSSTSVSGAGKNVGFDGVTTAPEIRDEENYGKVTKYESKIDSLMNEAGELKTQLDLQKVRADADRSEAELQGAKKVISEQEMEIQEFHRELDATVEENRKLREGIERLKSESEEGGDRVVEREGLLKKLVEVEMDAGEALTQVGDLKDLVSRLRADKKMSSTESAELAEKRTSLVAKLEDFESANRQLRTLLQSQHSAQVEAEQEAEQRQMLLRKLTEVDSVCQRQQKHIEDKSKLLQETSQALAAAQDQNKALISLQASLEHTRGHLQREVHKKEGEINRLQVALKSMEAEVEKSRRDVINASEFAESAKGKIDGDKEALKKAAKIQKQRALMSEQTVAKLNQKLLEQEEMIKTLNVQVEGEDGKGGEKELLEQEITKLRSLLSEMEDQLANSRQSFESQMEELGEELKIKLKDAKTLRSENERLTTSLAEFEENLKRDDDEIRELRAKLRNYEDMAEEYQTQAKRANQEFEDVSIRLQHQELELSKLHKEGELEVEKVKMRLQQRVKELEPLPDLLKDTEIKLHEALSQVRMLEKSSDDKIRASGELKAWLDHEKQGHELTREKLKIIENEFRESRSAVESYRKKLQEADDNLRTQSLTSSRQGDQIRDLTRQLEDKTKETSSLARQLEISLVDAKRADSEGKEKANAREREFQSQVLQLETQLSHSKTETCQAKRDKEDVDRRLSSKVADLKDRLEQSYSTNRSMQNYVHFLKTSYANVFGAGGGAASSSAALASDVNYLKSAVSGGTSPLFKN